jgi:hypothetical protein
MNMLVLFQAHSVRREILKELGMLVEACGRLEWWEDRGLADQRGWIENHSPILLIERTKELV